MNYFIQEGDSYMVTIEKGKVIKKWINNRAFKQDDDNGQLIEIGRNSEAIKEMIEWFINEQTGNAYVNLFNYVCPNEEYYKYTLECIAKKKKCTTIEAFKFIPDKCVNGVLISIGFEIGKTKTKLSFKEKCVLIECLRKCGNDKEKELFTKLYGIKTRHPEFLHEAMFKWLNTIYMGSFKSADYRNHLILAITDFKESIYNGVVPKNWTNISIEDSDKVCTEVIEDVVKSEKLPLSNNTFTTLRNRINGYMYRDDLFSFESQKKLLKLLTEDINITTKSSDIKYKLETLDGTSNLRYTMTIKNQQKIKSVCEEYKSQILTSPRVLKAMAENIMD